MFDIRFEQFILSFSIQLRKAKANVFPNQPRDAVWYRGDQQAKNIGQAIWNAEWEKR